MQQFTKLDKQLENFSSKLNLLQSNIVSIQSTLLSSDDLIKKTRKIRDDSVISHKKLLTSLNAHQQTIERQISEIRIAMGHGVEGERRNPLSDEDIQLIYQASVDGFTNEDFNKLVGGVTNHVLVVFDSEGNVFGGYSSKKVPIIDPDDLEDVPARGIYDDEEHIMFLLRRKGVTDVKKFTRKSEGYSFWAFGSVKNIVSIGGAFVLVNDCNRNFDSTISGNFKREYGEELFLEKKNFMVRDVVLIQFQ
ncbi:TLDc domain-containing protein [Entamoeba marina]